MNKFVNFNANPRNKKGCDCVVRAISKAMGKTRLQYIVSYVI